MFNKLFLSLTIAYFVNCTYLNNIHQPYNINLAGNVNPSVQSGAVNYGGGAYGQGEQPCPQEQQPCTQSTNPNIYVNQNVNVKGDNAQYQQPEQQPPCEQGQQPPCEQEQQPPCEQEQQPPCEQEQPPCPSCGGSFHGYGGCQSCGGMFHGLGGYGGYRRFGGFGGFGRIGY